MLQLWLPTKQRRPSRPSKARCTGQNKTLAAVYHTLGPNHPVFGFYGGVKTDQPHRTHMNFTAPGVRCEGYSQGWHTG